MKTLMMFTQYEMGILMTALVAVVAFQMLSGRIKTAGLLNDKSVNGSGGVSPARVQLLLFTMAFSFYIVAQVADKIAAGKPGEFPDIDVKWLALLGGSHSIFLGSKGLSMLLPQSKPGEGD
jgi:hypothetical protein